MRRALVHAFNRRRAQRIGVVLACLCLLGLSGYASSAQAGPFVSGSQGIEIEEARDRRGIYGGLGITIGAFAGRKQIFPTPQLNLRAGGGVSKNLTLGVSVMLARYFETTHDEYTGQWTIGADLEGQYAFAPGFFLHLGLGGIGIPKFYQQRGLTFGLGGRVGAGYEFFVDSHAAISILVDGDFRVTPKGNARFGPMISARVTWY